MPLTVIRDLGYGRNGGDPVLSLAETACVEAQNVVLAAGRVAKKRNGCAAISLAGSTITTGPLWLIRHNAGELGSADELWAGDGGGAAGIIARNLSETGGWNVISTPSAADNVNAGDRARGASFNGKLFLAYKGGAVNRCHVWDGTTLRRVGLATPAAPTVANTGTGTYAATIRYYKVAYTVQASGVTIRRSELSPSVSFTPSGVGTAARVTKPAALSEGETHWELYASANDTIFYLLVTTAVATTTYDDTTSPLAYDGEAEPLVGMNSPPVGCYYVLADETWLLWARETLSGNLSRVYYTAALGSSDVGDDERIPNTVDEQNWFDLHDKDADFITGLAGPFFSSPIVFKQGHIWKLVRTGDNLAPYRPILVPSEVGALEQETIALGEDENGDSAIYFLSLYGPYRLSVHGVEYLGRDVEDIWDTVNLANLGRDFHGVYDRHLREMWWWVNTTGGWRRLRLSIRQIRQGRGGWTVDTGTGVTTATSCSVLYLPSLTAQRTRYRPYSGGGGLLLRHDTGTTDNGTPFHAYVKTRPMPLGGIGNRVTVDDVSAVANAGEGVVTVTVETDFGASTQQQEVSLQASGAETMVQSKLDACHAAGAGFVQVQVGDTEATEHAWTVNAIVLPTKVLESR